MHNKLLAICSVAKHAWRTSENPFNAKFGLVPGRRDAPRGVIILAGGILGFLCKALAGSWSWRTTQETQRHRTGPMHLEKPSACPRRGDEGRTA